MKHYSRISGVLSCMLKMLMDIPFKGGISVMLAWCRFSGMGA
ncbi:hypothetical protein [Paenibacillus sp. J2TS4]|nr:hypothetical protein [Paenibacillus sp. J2TS4]